MSGDQRVVRVCGVPSRLPDDLVCDKLHIHFLRPHNGGGELLRLVYPTREKGVAVLMFELEEVAERILKRKHQLEVGGQTFPLEVMRPQILNTVAGVGISGTQKQPRLLKFSMPIRTTLDLQYFKDGREAEAMLEKYRLQILPGEGSQVEIQGEFQDLRRLRRRLQTMISEGKTGLPEHHAKEQQRVTPEQTHKVSSNQETVGFESIPGRDQHGLALAGNGKELATAVTGANQKSTQNSVSESYPSPSTVVYPVSGRATSPKAKLGSSSKSHIDERDSGSPTRDCERRSAARGSSSRSARGSSASRAQLSNVSPTSSQDKSSSAPSGFSWSFRVDKDILEYIQVFGNKYIDGILTECSVEIKTKYLEDLSHVTLSATSLCTSVLFEKARTDISNLFTNAQKIVITEYISLTEFLPNLRADIAEIMVLHGNRRGILTMVYKDLLHLIGPSVKVYEFMQEWKAKKKHIESDIINARGQIRNMEGTQGSSHPSNQKSTQNSVSESYPSPSTVVYPVSGRATSPTAKLGSSSKSHFDERDSGSPTRDCESRSAARGSSSRSARSSSASRAQLANVSPTSSQDKSSSAPSGFSWSFPVDKDILEYILFFGNIEIHGILTECLVEIKTKDLGDLSHVTLSAMSSCTSALFEKACKDISNLFTNAQKILRTEDISLTEFSPNLRAEIAEITVLKGNRRGILTRIYKDLLHLIGPSPNLYEFMQEWKAKKSHIESDIINARAQISEMKGTRGLPHPPATGKMTADADDKKEFKQDAQAVAVTGSGRGRRDGKGESEERGAKHGTPALPTKECKETAPLVRHAGEGGRNQKGNMMPPGNKTSSRNSTANKPKPFR